MPYLPYRLAVESVGWLFRGEAKSPRNTEKGGNQCEVSCLRFLPINLNEDKPDR